ncbi:hypothetical protein JCM19232_4368 [Vibrio ishigakensis]|uniref:Uncharacterized protein n=1 Tax=Vibrio ishigakensis TaxID=1481914 RepID=A0A0B8PED0_9VIBR|nr:hypothetical protein JCM19232_4368 [Vibrio ishigakensis]
MLTPQVNEPAAKTLSNVLSAADAELAMTAVDAATTEARMVSFLPSLRILVCNFHSDQYH